MKTRRNLTQEEKLIIGEKCCNCGNTNDLEYHHIIPLSLGGNNNLSNYCCLCYKCHSLLHFSKERGINHSKLTKIGLEKAKKSGKKLGLKKGTKLTTQKSIVTKEKILTYSKNFHGTLNDTDCIKLLGVARNTFYKYKRELVKELKAKEKANV